MTDQERLKLYEKAIATAQKIESTLRPQLENLRKSLALQEQEQLAKRKSVSADEVIPGYTDFSELVGAMQKAPKAELAKITPEMLQVIAAMKQAVKEAKAKLAANGDTVAQSFLEQLVSHAEGVIAMAENLVVLGPTGEVTRSAKGDDRTSTVDMIKLIRSGGGTEGLGAIFGQGPGVVSSTQRPDSDATLKAVAEAQKRPRNFF
jgi:hypothetical protein